MAGVLFLIYYGHSGTVRLGNQSYTIYNPLLPNRESVWLEKCTFAPWISSETACMMDEGTTFQREMRRRSR